MRGRGLDEKVRGLSNEDGAETRMAAIKKGALRLLKKMIVLVFEALSLSRFVETFEKII